MAKTARVPANFRRIDIVHGDRRGETHGWQALFTRDGRQRTKLFSDSKHGGPEGALVAANEWLERELRKVDPNAPRFLVQEIERLRAENLEMREELKSLRGGRCRECGCTDACACIGGCEWVELDWETGEGLCSVCAPKEVVRG